MITCDMRASYRRSQSTAPLRRRLGCRPMRHTTQSTSPRAPRLRRGLGLYGWRFQGADGEGESLVFDVYGGVGEWHVHRVHS